MNFKTVVGTRGIKKQEIREVGLQSATPISLIINNLHCSINPKF